MTNASRSERLQKSKTRTHLDLSQIIPSRSWRLHRPLQDHKHRLHKDLQEGNATDRQDEQEETTLLLLSGRLLLLQSSSHNLKAATQSRMHHTRKLGREVEVVPAGEVEAEVVGLAKTEPLMDDNLAAS